MSAAERYLRELRRALPLGCRRRFVAEVREHFASAAEAGEPEHLTIERLGSARVLADQLLGDVRRGELGRAARLTAGLTTIRLAACAMVIGLALVAGAVLTARHSAPPSQAHERSAHPAVTVRPTITLDPRTGEVRAVTYPAGAVPRAQGSITLKLTPVQYYAPSKRQP